MNDLKKLGVPTKVYYPKAVYEHEYFKNKQKKIDNVEYVKKNILSLPMHIYSKKNMDFFYKKIRDYLKIK